jgi:hypothetical protein
MFKTSGSVKALLITQGIVEMSLGLVPLLLPAVSASLAGSFLTEPEGYVLSRIAGASLISMGALSWAMRNSENSVLQHQVLSMFGLFQILVFTILLYGQLIDARGAAGWLAVCIHFIFAVSFSMVLRHYDVKKNDQTKC